MDGHTSARSTSLKGRDSWLVAQVQENDEVKMMTWSATLVDAGVINSILCKRFDTQQTQQQGWEQEGISKAVLRTEESKGNVAGDRTCITYSVKCPSRRKLGTNNENGT